MQPTRDSLIDGRYRLDEEIGHGGFGVVYSADDLTNGSKVAVKIFNPAEGNESSNAIDRFKLEAASVQRILHPNVVRVLSSGVTDAKVMYIAMELLEGRPLRHWVSSAGKLNLAMAAKIGLACADVLTAAHAMNVLHRDIKPDNIFIHKTSSGYDPKVLDFGVAKIFGMPGAQALTQTGTVVGTPAYMAPERIEQTSYDGRSDVYSLGTVLFQLLTGAMPFEMDPNNILLSVMRKLDEEPRNIAQFAPGLPKGVQAAVMHALAREPADRPQADAFAKEWAAALAEAGIVPADDADAERRLREADAADMTMEATVITNRGEL